MVICVVFLIILFSFVVAIFYLVHDVESIFHLPELLTACTLLPITQMLNRWLSKKKKLSEEENQKSGNVMP